MCIYTRRDFDGITNERTLDEKSRVSGLRAAEREVKGRERRVEDFPRMSATITTTRSNGSKVSINPGERTWRVLLFTNIHMTFVYKCHPCISNKYDVVKQQRTGCWIQNIPNSLYVFENRNKKAKFECEKLVSTRFGFGHKGSCSFLLSINVPRMAFGWPWHEEPRPEGGCYLFATSHPLVKSNFYYSKHSFLWRAYFRR